MGINLLNKERTKLYVWLSVTFLLLWLIGDVLTDSGTILKRTVNNVWLVAYLLGNHFLLFEHTLLFNKPTWQRIFITPLLIVAHLLAYSFGLYAWRYLGVELGIYTPLKIHGSMLAGVTYHFPYSIVSALYFGIIKFIYDNHKLMQTAQQLRIEKQVAELDYLKSQTNPHFLFNTLNNIYSLSRDKSDLAPESILRLSKILRFMLYETGGAYILVEEELKIISDYIELEKLRYDSSLVITFNYQIKDMKQLLPPLLLMPLIQNAFKHGASETMSHPFVDITLTVDEKQLMFIVKNSVEEFSSEPAVKENIGLSNLRRQLELLYHNYSLSIKKDSGLFKAMLMIDLKSHV
jgi:two-component system LytT family sensor kinase